MATRCSWADGDPLYIEYHDLEWGVPVHDDRKHFECLILEGAQAGLSWITVLRKRESYRTAFDGFDPNKVAEYGDDDVRRLIANEGIIRNKLKVNAAISNARAFLMVQEEFGSFDAYSWSFVGGLPRKNNWTQISEVPAVSPESEAMSKDLKKRGFKFVGPTIIYAHMQAVGMVNDHLTTCFRYDEV
jgi:DNA-3-methyladenine glycosylase I